MTARPILFRDAMVRALLDGRKTQTRRVVKHRWPHLYLEPYYATGRVLCDLPTQPGAWMEFRHRQQDEVGYEGSPASFLVPCPYGAPGDLLWVREAWAPLVEHYKDGTPLRSTSYRADGVFMPKWRPSIHMPRAASRLTLRVAGVRVERVAAISEADALAEGIFSVHGKFGHAIGAVPQRTARDAFHALWDSMRAGTPESWDANPWVWVIEFEVIKSNINEVIK